MKMPDLRWEDLLRSSR